MARPRTDIEARIVRAARRCFVQQGVDATSLRRVAERAKTSIGMIYYYFPTKDDLFLAVVEEPYQKLLLDLERALAADASVETRLRRLYVRIGGVSDEELLLVRMILREVLVSTSRRDKLIERFKRGHLPMVIATLLDGVQDGTFDRKYHPALLFLATLTLGTAPQFLRRSAGDRLPIIGAPQGERLSNMLVDVLLHGIGAAAS
jgi:AcrR family transcriptional regulator